MKQVIVVRSDLNMRRGKEAAQVAHASLMAVLPHLGGATVNEWMGECGQCKIVVSVASEADLMAAFWTAKADGLICSLVQDAGRTEFNGVPTYTCAAIGPGPTEAVDAVTRAMKLR